MEEKYFTVTEVAKMFGVTRQTIHNWMAEEKLGYETIGSGNGKIIIISAAAIEARKEQRINKLEKKIEKLKE